MLGVPLELIGCLAGTAECYCMSGCWFCISRVIRAGRWIYVSGQDKPGERPFLASFGVWNHLPTSLRLDALFVSTCSGKELIVSAAAACQLTFIKYGRDGAC